MLTFQRKHKVYGSLYKVSIVHKYGGYLNKYPESVQICHLLYKYVQNMTFKCNMN